MARLTTSTGTVADTVTTESGIASRLQFVDLRTVDSPLGFMNDRGRQLQTATQYERRAAARCAYCRIL
jgi:hypothetical protein